MVAFRTHANPTDGRNGRCSLWGAIRRGKKMIDAVDRMEATDRRAGRVLEGGRGHPEVRCH